MGFGLQIDSNIIPLSIFLYQIWDIVGILKSAIVRGADQRSPSLQIEKSQPPECLGRGRICQGCIWHWNWVLALSCVENAPCSAGRRKPHYQHSWLVLDFMARNRYLNAELFSWALLYGNHYHIRHKVLHEQCVSLWQSHTRHRLHNVTDYFTLFRFRNGGILAVWAFTT